MSDDVNALVEGEDLSEDFKNKAKVVFEVLYLQKLEKFKKNLNLKRETRLLNHLTR